MVYVKYPLSYIVCGIWSPIGVNKPRTGADNCFLSIWDTIMHGPDVCMLPDKHGWSPIKRKWSPITISICAGIVWGGAALLFGKLQPVSCP